MESRAQFLGHPVHQILVELPVGAFVFAVTCDTLHTVTRQRAFVPAARLALDFGLITATAAAPFGLVDWLAIRPGTRAKRVGLVHALGNLVMLGLFTSARALRGNRRAAGSAKWLAATGLGVAGVTAWLGGELINRHGVGVHDLVGEDAPSSLSRRTEVTSGTQDLGKALIRERSAS
ncbi:MAG: DUF2231 domain-containing protein [Myxococcota bacterium]|jgi:uncharacterized membrane protein|nr:DUF2231 domain-containing protein [Myxococcota bacterium]